MWLIVRRFGLLALGIVGLWLLSVLVLNLTVYSPTSYVTSYLKALESGNYPLAAAKAGLNQTPEIVPVPSETLRNPRVVDITSLATGELVIRADYELGDTTESTVFLLSQGDPVLWFFDTWTFHEPPLGTIEFWVVGDQRVTVNNTRLALGNLGVPPRTTVFIPGVYTSSLETDWIVASPVTSILTEVGAEDSIRLRVNPSPKLLETTTEALEDYLNECAALAVLQPSACPFGVVIIDRVLGAPQWTILDYPSVQLNLSTDRASWTMTAQGGVAEVIISVQSLFDGTIEERRETRSFSVVGVVRGTTIDQPVLNLY